MDVGVYDGKDFWQRYVFSLEWKSEGVMDDDSASGDDEEDEGEEDWLRKGSCSETGSLFQRWGDACRNERFFCFFFVYTLKLYAIIRQTSPFWLGIAFAACKWL